jgi:MinD-like ATPase involved in chromosome partitioning or flagellar assembly
MTTTEQNTGTRRLPGAARARAFAEPPAEAAPVARPKTAALPFSPEAAGTVSKPASAGVDEPRDSPSPVASWSSQVVAWKPPAPSEAPAEWGRRRTVLKVLSLGLAKPKPGREELDHRRNERLIRSAAWPRSVRIAVANPKGGAGKTPTALLLGGTLATNRGGSVAVWDAADAAGSLSGIAEGVQAQCISEVEADPGRFAHPGTIAACAATQTSNADVLASLADREFSGDSIDRVLWALDRTYRISVADTGNVPHSEAFTAVIAQADILVVPTTITASSVDKALHLLDRLQATSSLTQRAVVAVLHTRGPETPGLASRMTDLFSGVGVGAVLDIPFDPAIAAGTPISLDSLNRPSRIAWTQLAAATVANITLDGDKD